MSFRAPTADPGSEFRPDQLDVVRRLVGEGQRVLLEQFRPGHGLAQYLRFHAGLVEVAQARLQVVVTGTVDVGHDGLASAHNIRMRSGLFSTNPLAGSAGEILQIFPRVVVVVYVYGAIKRHVVSLSLVAVVKNVQ